MSWSGRLITLLALVILALACWVLLRPAPPQQPRASRILLARLDLDGDGSVALDELELPLPEAARGTSSDLDQDGSLSAAEFEAFLRYLDPTWFRCGGV